ncbi:MAG: hypothetical protein V2B14_00335 [bacterium]
MSVPKNKLHELIDKVSENDTGKVLNFLEKLIERKKDRFYNFYSEPLKVDKIHIYPRDKLYER